MIELKEYKNELVSYIKLEKKTINMLKNKKIMITGAAGLIGSYLSDLLIMANDELQLSAKLFLIDRNKSLLYERFSNYNDKVKLLAIDINSEMIDDLNIDYMFHCASNTSPIDYVCKPIDTMITNIIGTKKMIDFSIKNSVKRFIYCSSVEIYGKNGGDIDEFTENYSGYVNCNTVRASYPSAKRCAETMLSAYNSEHPEFNYSTARIGRIYGPTVIWTDEKAPTQFIRNAVRKEDIVLKSSGLQQYSWCYVGDCAIALIYILVYGKECEVYNVSDSYSNAELREFAENCASSANVKVVYSMQNDEEMKAYSGIQKATMNVDKLKSLGWTSKINLNEGIKNTIEFLKDLKINKIV